MNEMRKRLLKHESIYIDPKNKQIGCQEEKYTI